VDLLIVASPRCRPPSIRTDSNIIDAALHPWRRVRVGAAAAAVVSLVAMVAFTRWLGLPGLLPRQS